MIKPELHGRLQVSPDCRDADPSIMCRGWSFTIVMRVRTFTQNFPAARSVYSVPCEHGSPPAGLLAPILLSAAAGTPGTGAATSMHHDTAIRLVRNVAWRRHDVRVSCSNFDMQQPRSAASTVRPELGHKVSRRRMIFACKVAASVCSWRTWLLRSLPHADLAANATELRQRLPPLSCRCRGLQQPRTVQQRHTPSAVSAFTRVETVQTWPERLVDVGTRHRSGGVLWGS